MGAPSLSSSTTPNPKFTSKLPSSSDLPPTATAALRRPKSREVTSRYLTSSTPSCRPSPRTAPNSPASAATSPLPSSSNNRSRSADRHRPPTAAERMMMVVSASFQGVTTTPAAVVGRRRREEGDENARPRGSFCFTSKGEARRSFECDNALEKKNGRQVARALQMQGRSSVDDDDDREKEEEGGSALSSSVSGSTIASDLATSDAESVLSRRPRAMAVPARFWQETTNRLRRLPEQNAAKMSFGDSNLISSPPRILGARGTSPSKAPSAMSPSRGKLSPSRVRSVIRRNDYVSNTPSVSSFAADTRRGKVGENKISNMHELKMLHNRQLQWQFANARANAATQTQQDTTEKSINCAREKISELRDSVGSKRVELKHLRQQLKLYSMLEKQMPYLDEWELFDGDYSSSLAGAVESLVSSTLRLPLVGGAKANIQELEETISSAVDVTHAIGSSLCGLLGKVVQTNSLASELASISRNELSSLDQCRDLLSNLTAMQVEDCCLRTQRLQLPHINP